MNLKLRLKNKATLTSLIMAAVAFIYQVLGILNVVNVPISQNDVKCRCWVSLLTY